MFLYSSALGRKVWGESDWYIAQLILTYHRYRWIYCPICAHFLLNFYWVECLSIYSVPIRLSARIFSAPKILYHTRMISDITTTLERIMERYATYTSVMWKPEASSAQTLRMNVRNLCPPLNFAIEKYVAYDTILVFQRGRGRQCHLKDFNEVIDLILLK